MKLRNKKLSNLIRKGLSLTLAFSMISGLFTALPSKAAGSNVSITDTNIEDFYSYMVEAGYSQANHKKAKDRIVLFSDFLSSVNPDIKAIPSEDRDDYETSDVVWNPSQEKVDDNRDLYFLQWTNGEGYFNPGSGYEILARIVFITHDGELRYSKQVNIDDYPRALLDLGHKAQWDNLRINQCTFAVPDDCAQIVGLYMCNQSGGGNNNNTWWMDSLYIYRIESDKVSDITKKEKNALDHNQCSFKSGQLSAYVSAFDLDKRYLQTMDKNEEWLYLLQTPDPLITETASGSTYYAEILTGNYDLSGKNLTLEIIYTDITGRECTHKQVLTDENVENFYPELTRLTYFSTGNKYWASACEPLYILKDLQGFPAGVAGESYGISYDKTDTETTTYANPIAVEVPKGKKVKNTVVEELQTYGKFTDYSWENDNLAVTNLYSYILTGNYAGYDEMKKDLFGPYTATDVKLDITNHIKEIKEIKLSMKKGSGYAELQDVRIYTSSSDNFTRTRMNGGIGTERIFFDVKDALCIASLDQSKLIQLDGTRVSTCLKEPDPYVITQHKLITHTNKRMSLMAEDDNLGVEISIADIYNAGYEIFMAYMGGGWERLPARYYDTVNDAYYYDPYLKLEDVRTFLLEKLPEKTDLIDRYTAMELLNVIGNFYKESINLHIRYKDDFGSIRDVKVPFISSYVMQLYSDNNGKLGGNTNEFLTGILQQGEDVGLRIPLSQYSEIIDIKLSFGKETEGVKNFRNNKRYYDPSGLVSKGYDVDWEEMWRTFNAAEDDGPNDNFVTREELASILDESETIMDGKRIPNSETISIRAIRFYDHVTKEKFYTTYDRSKRVTYLITDLESDYYYEAQDKKGTSFAVGRELFLSTTSGTLKKGTVDYSDADLKNTYLVQINTQILSDHRAEAASDLYVTISYTSVGGEEKKINSTLLSELGKDYTGGNNIKGMEDFYQYRYEPQAFESMRGGAAYFLLELDDVSRFDYIHLSIPDGEEYSIQVNSINIYDLDSLSSRYSAKRSFTTTPVFYRDFTGTKIAVNNKPAALMPNREGNTFYFSKITSDGIIEDPNTDNTYVDEYLKTPPTSMTYEETLKNLGLAITKYTYTVDVKVANVLDAGSSNYFYFQLVFENGTSGVVLANQQLASDSFRQGYTETFTINTTQNYGNITGVRVICDTTSSTSQAFDKLNIDSITVSLPSKGGAKSWIMDNVGWIDINFQDEGNATTVSEDGRNGGFPNSQVVKEFAKTRTASTARLLFNISTAADSKTNNSRGETKTASIIYEDSAGYTQTYNFDLHSVAYNFIENENPSFVFQPNTSTYFTVSINDVVSVKSLNIYRTNGFSDWDIKDVTISQFSDMGAVYRSITGDFKRYLENETLLATSTNSNVKIAKDGTGTFTFTDHSISIDTVGNDPEGWTTTITRLPATTQENLNVYLYAGSTNYRTYNFNPANIPEIKGRAEYSLKEGSTTNGSTAFTFTDVSEINGTTVLKASGVKVTGMSQLKTLHLETSSMDLPIISGARVERVRGNTIVETLYFDFANTEMNAEQNYSTYAKADKLSSATKQTVALQLSTGQEQLFTASSDVAVALLYTSESSSSDSTKTVYSSPYVFFTDVGIDSVGSASILEIPFEISGVDKIAGISIISNGPNVKFENAIVYNYVSNVTGEKTLIDVCQISEKFSTSTVEKQLMETADTNVTPVTLNFITSPDSDFQGAGTSGRLPLNIRYKTLDGKDASLQINNFANLLPTGTLPTAGSTVSFKVQLSNFSQLTDIVVSATDDDWHLNKVSAAIDKFVNAASSTYTVEAFVNQWITRNTPVTAVFNNGNDSLNSPNQIVNFSITGITSKSGNVTTATNGNILTIKAAPGENVHFTPQVTTSGTPNNSVIWDISQYEDYVFDGGNDGLTFRVPTDSVGQVFSFTSYCSFDTQKTITIVIEVIHDVPATESGGTSGDEGTTGDDSATIEETSVDVKITITKDGTTSEGPVLPSFKKDSDSPYTILVNPNDTDSLGDWNFSGTANSSDCKVTFAPASLNITNGTVATTVMTCKDSNNNVIFDVTIKVISLELTMNIAGSGTNIQISNTSLKEGVSCVVTIPPYNGTEVNYTLELTIPSGTPVSQYSKAVFTNSGENIYKFSNLDYQDVNTTEKIYARYSLTDGNVQSFVVPITIKVAN